MKSFVVTIPYPPSVNRIYFNRMRKDTKGNRVKGRGLTTEAREYKDHVSNLIGYLGYNCRFGDSPIKVTILDKPRNGQRDSHNGIKIVFDAIEQSGLIDNDKQIIAYEVIPGIFANPPSWVLKLEPYLIPREDFLL